MSKSFLSKMLGCLVLVCVCVFWLLSITMPDTFGWFNLSWAVAIISGGFAVLILTKSIFSQQSVTHKKLFVLLTTILAVICALSIIFALVLPTNIILPILFIVLTGGMLMSVVVTGGKSWDQGDNKKVGYKNYFQRTKQKEQQKQDEQNEQFK